MIPHEGWITEGLWGRFVLSCSVMPSKRMIQAAAAYLAGATRCKMTWEASFQRVDQGEPMTNRDLVEMHGAALGMIWATHTTDLDSALAILDRLEVDAATLHQDALDRSDLARRILEIGISPTHLAEGTLSEGCSAARPPRPLVSR
jgi:hypothetical protein